LVFGFQFLHEQIVAQNTWLVYPCEHEELSMSGGSYNLLFAKDLYGLLQSGLTDLSRMADRLTELGATDAAAETEEIGCIVRQATRRIETRLKRMEAVWKAVEWYDSNDWGKETVDEALAVYRGEEPATEAAPLVYVNIRGRW
jgi:hypothetical protein